MNFKNNLTAFFLLLSLQFVFGQYVTDPLPYAPIANPLPDTMDQLYRDSVNLSISRVRVNQAGYRIDDEKLFYYVGSSASEFTVINIENSNIAGTGTLQSTGKQTSGQLNIKSYHKAQLISGGDIKYELLSPEISGTVFKGFLPQLAEGRYKVIVNSDTSAPFIINDNVYGMAKDALIKYFGIARCGDNDSWFHDDCHLKDIVPGGWHDAGDHLKVPQSIGYAVSVLGLCATALKDRDTDHYAFNHAITQNTDRIPDVLRETKVGADYIINSYDQAAGNVSAMKTEIGEYGYDHGWWGRPEYQDMVIVDRGGPPRAAEHGLGGNTSGSFAAGLAFFAKEMQIYDPEYSEKCLKVAKELYRYGKQNPECYYNAAMNGGGMSYDELAFAALALWYATKDTIYRYDLLYNKEIGTHGEPEIYPRGGFEGGWFVTVNPGPQKTGANTSWDNLEVYALWGLYRLILKDEDIAAEYGIDSDERLNLIEDIIYCLIVDIGDISIENGDQAITLPQSSFHWKKNVLQCDELWGTMHDDLAGAWMPNRYQAGNITELYCYYDIASDIQGMELPNTPGSTDWKTEEVKSVLLKQMNFMLGLNPWDVSMIVGVGSKNLNHPHHRASNPELQNTPGAFYKYCPPVGALSAGYLPATSLYDEFMGGFNGYYHTEISLDATTAIFLPVMGLAKLEPLKKPGARVKILYVGCDNAIIEVSQTRYGTSTIRYGTNSNPEMTVSSDSATAVHRIELTDLLPGTEYCFDVLVSDLFGNDSVILNIDEDKKPVYFTFTTLQNCLTEAEIANVKICQVTSDSAEIFWYTPNGAFDSRVVFGESKPPTTVHDGDIAGVPVKFHFVKIGGLKEKTTYYFYVQSGETIDDNGGVYYEFTTPVEHVDFDIRAVRYYWGDLPGLGMNIVNQDVKAYDSLDVRLYFRAKEGFENDLGARLDIGIVYDEAGFQKSFDSLNTPIREAIMRQKPNKMEDTYNEADGTYAYYLSVPLWGIQMRSGSRIRLDVIFDRRSPYPPYEDLMNQPPEHELSDDDWSFGPHSKEKGEPYDYKGIPIGEKGDIDDNYWSQEINHYITVYRKGEFIWGYSPSFQEQQTKKNQYTLETLITDPLQNPSDDYILYERTVPSVDVSGWAKITPIDGTINNIWINGIELENPHSCVNWSEQKQRYDFTIPVPVKNGPNPTDIVFFAGPGESCVDCYGCAASTHSFFIEFTGAKQYPSSISLRDLSMNPLTSDTARIDTTVFHVVVTDRNGNIDGQAVDTMYVSITNSLTGDSISVMLLETGDSTNTFQTVLPVVVVSTSSQQDQNHIYMMGGDKILITYIDPTDPTDISEAYLVSKADFPVALSGYYKDENGDGKVDRLFVQYNRQLDSLPDSVIVTFPDETTVHTLRNTVDPFEIVGTDMLSVTLNSGFEPGVTGFGSGGKGSGTSYLTSLGAVKISSFEVTDSIGPVLLNSVTLHEKNDSGRDTLTIQFSEMITASSLIDNALILHGTDGENELVVHGILNVENRSNSLTILVTSPVEIKRGDSVTINSSGLLTDMVGNHAHPQNPKVPVVIRENAPQLLSGVYKDTDANGIIDHVELVFTKSILIEDLILELSWENGTRKEVDHEFISFAGDERTEIVVGIEGFLTGDRIVTDGKMRAFARFGGFEDYESVIDVSDKAAPVIISAILSPSGETENIIDTLIVEFSEPAVINSKEPFELYSDDLSKNYSFVIGNFNNVNNKTVKFYVSEFVGIEFPSNRDSIRINPQAGISDMIGNSQDNPINRRVLMDVKPLPVTVKLEGGPNPFIVNQSLINNDVELPAQIAGKLFGYLLKVIPISRVNTKQEISGEVKIYDALGNYVYGRELIASKNQNSSVKYFHWEGTNKKGRYVGSGTYLAIVRVKNSTGMEIKERIFIGVKR